MPFYSRKPTRIPNYDYSRNNYYFITVCTQSRKSIFGMPGQHTDMGKIVENHILNLPGYYENVLVDKYVVMPNHVHMILVMNGQNNPNASLVIGQWKRGITKEIRQQYPQYVVWQRSFHDHVIRNQAGYEKIWMYIDSNPVNWKKDCFYLESSENEG